MNNLQRYLSTCLLAMAALVVGAAPAWAQTAPSLDAASSVAVLSAAPDGGGAVTCTDSAIKGDVGSSGAPASVVQTSCTINGAVLAPVSEQVLTDFNDAYNEFAALSCTTMLNGTLAGVTLDTPGVYCVDAVAKTGVLTLNGDGIWIFKVAADPATIPATGALTGTNFSVVLNNGATACNVYWWVAEAATLTDSDFKGTILAGAAITTTGGTFEGRALAKAAVTLTGASFVGCEGGTPFNPPQQRCNQGVGNGPEGCDPGNSNQGNPFRSNDELGGVPGNPGKKGGWKK